MANIRLCEMMKELCRMYFNGFVNDPMVYADMERFADYEYSNEACNKYWQRHRDLGRIHMAIMLDAQFIGVIILKNVDTEAESSKLSIHLKNDSVKNKGYGTRAEILVLQYAFNVLDMKTVSADVLLKNQRSQRVLI